MSTTEPEYLRFYIEAFRRHRDAAVGAWSLIADRKWVEAVDHLGDSLNNIDGVDDDDIPIFDNARKTAVEFEALEAENRALREVLDRPDYHIIRFTESDWCIQHPPQDGASLFDCPYNQIHWDQPPPEGPGDYRLELTDGEPVLTPLDESAESRS